jgi:VanZ family protein
MKSRIGIICRPVAWILLLTIAVLSLVPPAVRPVTIFPHAVEHFVIFFLAGSAFALGYPRRELLQMVGLIAFAAFVEVAQMYAPGRHARLSDFVIDAGAACVGVATLLVAT